MQDFDFEHKCDPGRALARREPRNELTVEAVRQMLRQTSRYAVARETGDPSDAVVSLRELGTTRTFALRPLSIQPLSSEDDRRRFDVVHPEVQFVCARGLWRITDFHGIADLHYDGTRCREAALTAGAEVAFGGMTMIVESARSIALRQFCARLIGWSDERLGDVDRALRAIRACQLRRAPLLLRGPGDMAAIALALHRRMVGIRAPFIVVDPKRANAAATTRSAPNLTHGLVAMRAAAGGSLCIREVRRPPDFAALLQAFRSPASDVQLMVCANERVRHTWLSAVDVVELPPLATRAGELERVIVEYTSDARTALRVPPSACSEQDIAWVRCVSAQSLPDIEKATQRAVAIRASRNMHAAARMLGMAPVSLARWLGRRVKDPKTGAPIPSPVCGAG